MSITISDAYYKAAKVKLRFKAIAPTTGEMTIEDLDRLDIVKLEAVGVAIEASMPKSSRFSVRNAEHELNDLRLVIIEDIIRRKKDELLERSNNANNAKAREHALMELERRKLEKLSNVSDEELKKIAGL